jgi:AAA+ superfamily predicted ATPase
VVTANNLIARYVGNTGHNVVEAMRKAKGGILFIDGLYPSFSL